MRRGHLVALGAACGAVLLMLRPGSDWYHDVVTRAYAADHFIPHASESPIYEAAATAAGAYTLPVGWLLELHQAGVPPDRFPQAASALHRWVASHGPPSDASPPTLAAYKRRALEAALGEVRHAA